MPDHRAPEQAERSAHDRGACRRCDRPLDDLGWCAPCRRGARLRAGRWAEVLLDEADELPGPSAVASGDPLGWPGYPEQRAEAPGEEAVRCWHGTLDGRELVLVAFDFAHLGGSMGSGVGARVGLALEHARQLGLPAVTVTASGGARMQEGMAALAQMPATVAAAEAHRAAGLAQLTVATDPTTGGVWASLANRAHLVAAEPGAYVAFAGPRVARSLGAEPADARGPAAEAALGAGLVDDLVERPDLRGWLSTRLAALEPGPGWDESPAADPPAEPEVPDLPAADLVAAARDDRRPRAGALLDRLAPLAELRGDRCGGVDGGVRTAVGRLAGRPVTVVALDRTAPTPAGYRAACRLVETADALGMGVLTVVDTPGADTGLAAERAGQAHWISRTFATLLGARGPTCALVTGEGGSGGALALATCDRVLISPRAVFSVIAPEAAAAILHGEGADDAAERTTASNLRPDAATLRWLGVADRIAPEPDDADELLAAASWALADAAADAPSERLRRRAGRWARAGQADLAVRDEPTGR